MPPRVGKKYYHANKRENDYKFFYGKRKGMFFIGNCEINFEFFINAHVANVRERGIQIEQCANALIHDNTSERLGLSVKGAGSLLGTQFKCNTSDGSYNGFYFDAAYGTSQTAISKQGDSTHPWDNKWYPYSGSYYGIDGPTYNAPLKKWFYRNSGQYIPTINPSLAQYISITLAVNPVAVNCQSCTYGYMMAGSSMFSTTQSIVQSGSTVDNNEMDGIINESNNYNEMDESFKYFEKQYAYHKLDENTESLNAQTGQYYYDLKNGNIGKFDEIYRKIEAGDINNASLLNNQIAPVNNIEQYRKWVNAVYFDYIVIQKEIPQNIIDDLETLASSSPFVNGDAVYTARAILGYTEILPENNKSLEKQNEENTHAGTIVVYPNPANDEVFVLLDGYENGQKIEVELYNILGTLIINKQVISSNEAISICTAKIPAGSYILVLKTASKTLYKNRLVVIK